MEVRQSDFGNGTNLFSMVNDNGVRLDVSDFGARIVNLVVPTDTGERNIVLGFESSEDYTTQDSYIGATSQGESIRVDLNLMARHIKSKQILKQDTPYMVAHQALKAKSGKVRSSGQKTKLALCSH